MARPLLIFHCCICLTGLLADDAQATNLTAVEDNNTFKGAPTVVQGASGSADTLATKEASAAQGNSRTIFVKFSLAGVLPAEGNTATFNITTSAIVSGAQFTMQLFALDAGATGFNWSESTITWNNSPAISTNAATNYLDLTKATAVTSTFPVAQNTAAGKTISVTFSDWDTYRQADDSLTLILVTTSQTSATPSLSFASSESAAFAAPQLVIPEPSQTLLLGSGLMTLLAGRRRRRR